MQITDLIAQTGGLRSIARELGINEAEAAKGAAALAPAVLGGFKKQAQSSGLDGLGGMLGKLGGGALLDDVVAPQPTNVSRGNDVLGQIFGSKDVSRTVAQNAAAKTGLSPELLKKMLPIVAMAVTGFLAKQRAADAAPSTPADASPAPTGGGGLGGMLGGLLGRKAAGPQRTGATSGLTSMLDMNGDGNPLDDIMRMAGKMMR